MTASVAARIVKTVKMARRENGRWDISINGKDVQATDIPDAELTDFLTRHEVLK